jgi:hypothetical protein
MEFQHYNIHYSVDYNNNDEYRIQIQKVFNMDIDNLNKNDDEVLYDDVAIRAGLEFIFSKTKDNPHFITLYEKAGALLMTDNSEMGLAVLFSYDFLSLFHKLLYVFFFEPNTPIDSDSNYIELLNKIKR